MHCLKQHFVLSDICKVELHVLRQETALKIWLNPGLNLTISDEPGQAWTFISVSVGSRPVSYLFTSASAQELVHSAPKCDTEPIQYVILLALTCWGVAVTPVPIAQTGS